MKVYVGQVWHSGTKETRIVTVSTLRSDAEESVYFWLADQAGKYKWERELWNEPQGVWKPEVLCFKLKDCTGLLGYL